MEEKENVFSCILESDANQWARECILTRPRTDDKRHKEQEWERRIAGGAFNILKKGDGTERESMPN